MTFNRDCSIELLTTPEGRLVVCDVCDFAVDKDGAPVKLVMPKHQMQLNVAHATCTKCKQWRSWEAALLGDREITLSPLVCKRIQAQATVNR